jgi:hypothetical protein
MNSFDGAVEAAAELHSHLFGAGEHETAAKLIDDAVRRGEYFATKVAELMETRGSTAAAAELRRRLNR